jgi:NitT/TauT family transport system substrate-binding protein
MNGNKTKTIAALTLALLASISTAYADTGKMASAYQNGLTYYPIMLMEANHTFEKHAKALGIKDAEGKYFKMGGPGAVIDAMNSDTVQCGSVGANSVTLLYVKTRGAFKLVSSLSYMPIFLNSSNPAIVKIEDYKDKEGNRIPMPTQFTSVQAEVFHMAQAKAFGIKNYNILDRLTQTMPHPDAMGQLISGRTEINNHFTSPPYQYQELKEGKGKIHRVLSSYDVLGKSTFVTEMCSVKFEKENPTTMKAFTEALLEELNWINTHKEEAAKKYIELSKTKESYEEVLSQLNDKDIEFNPTPLGIEKYSKFMKETGVIKADKAPTLKEMSFPFPHNLKGN